MNERLGIIIINYNTFEDCCRCVDSIQRFGIVASGSVVIVDNFSPDASGKRLAEKFSHIKVVLADRNGGYGAGINLGVAQLTRDFYLILNPDTLFKENKIETALAVFDQEPRLGLLGLHLEYADGTHQDSARRFFSFLTILLRRTPLGRLSLMQGVLDEHLMKRYWSETLFEADWVTGAAFIVRGKAFEEIGAMDEGYFLYMEDTDLCKRMWLAGWVVKAISTVSITHILQRESAKSLFGKANRTFMQSLIRYASKYGMPIWGHGRRL